MYPKRSAADTHEHESTSIPRRTGWGWSKAEELGTMPGPVQFFTAVVREASKLKVKAK